MALGVHYLPLAEEREKGRENREVGFSIEDTPEGPRGRSDARMRPTRPVLALIVGLLALVGSADGHTLLDFVTFDGIHYIR